MSTRRAFRLYADYYLSTNRQVYSADLLQLGSYIHRCHDVIDRRPGTPRSSDIITEIYVPRDRLLDFVEAAREHLIRDSASVVYGTIRLIEQDDESFLAWAKQSCACIVFNLCTQHTDAGFERSATAFRNLIDLAVERGGSFFLTYHRFATRTQVDACYPQFEKFLRLKCLYDPDERFTSDWIRHYRAMYG